jgi:TonB family protein
VEKTAVANIIIGSGLLLLSAASGQTIHEGAIPPCNAPREEASAEKIVRPKYPRDALNKGKGGEVDLRVIVAPNGKVTDLTVLKGEPEFSKSSLVAIQKWRFSPHSLNGHPSEASYRVQVRFNPLLEEASSSIELESPRQDWSAIPSGVHDPDFGPDVHKMSEPGMIAPQQIYSPGPEFSERAREKGYQYIVSLSVVVGMDGLPKDIQVVCCREPDLNEKAVEATKRWRFAPATKNGAPVAVAPDVEVSFKLN